MIGDLLLCSRFVRSVTVKSMFVVSRLAVLHLCTVWVLPVLLDGIYGEDMQPCATWRPAPPLREASNCTVSLAVLASVGSLAAAQQLQDAQHVFGPIVPCW